jgi:hypothetical protein
MIFTDEPDKINSGRRKTPLVTENSMTTISQQPRNPLPSRALCHGFTTWRGVPGLFVTQMTEEERKEKAKIYALNWRLKNPDKYRDLIARASAKDKAKRKKAREEKAKIPKMTWKQRNPEKAKAHRAKWYEKNKEKQKIKVAKWQSENKVRFANVKNEYKKRKKIEDPIYAMAERIRSRTALAFKNNGFKKQSRTEKMLGCTFKQFTKHIEIQFTDGMSWDNRSEWHLDHILPLSCATTIEGLEKLSHYTNIRPLWAADNLSKSDNLVLI